MSQHCFPQKKYFDFIKPINFNPTCDFLFLKKGIKTSMPFTILGKWIDTNSPQSIGNQLWVASTPLRRKAVSNVRVSYFGRDWYEQS